ncbi:MAG: CRAL-TRIO domain-containing protein [Linnemannia elongata]|nr:MAG: CRAL-TRIO domain-containing protein [Linnemannia elongata]
MAKGDIMTPPGTGYIDNLTPDQTAVLKEVWSIIFHIADSGEAVVPSDMMREVEKEALSGKGAQTPTVQAAAKAGWFSGNKSVQAEEAAKAEGHGQGMAKISLEDLGLSVDKLRPILWDNVMGDHPDALVLRFIRARKWNTINALSMMFKAFKWRLDEDIPAVKYSSDIQLNDQNPKFFEQLEMGKFYIKGTDVDGRMVAYLNVRLHHPSDQPPKTLEKLTIYVMECGRVMVEHPVETVCLVFDLTGFSLSNMDFAMVRYLISIFEAYYPESLGRIVVHGAPFVFWGVWKIIEPWMDPVVASKVRFTRKDQDLLEYIPAEHLPSRYKGGLDKYEYKYIHAQEGENDHMADTASKDLFVAEWKALMWKFEALTREWVQLGTEKQVDLERTEEVVVKERQELAKQLRVAYFKMDPYIRARNLFHRQGVALSDGGVKWTYDN